MKSRSLRVVLAASTAVVLLASCSSQANDEGAAAAVAVRVTAASSGSVQLTDDLPGRVVAFRVAEIRPQVGGIVQRKLFTEGAIVRAESDSAAASLQRAEITRDKAAKQVDRLRPLVEVDAVSQQAFDDAEGARPGPG